MEDVEECGRVAFMSVITLHRIFDRNIWFTEMCILIYILALYDLLSVFRKLDITLSQRVRHWRR